MILIYNKKIISLLLCLFIFLSLFVNINNLFTATANSNLLVEAPLSESFLEYQKDFNSNYVDELHKYNIIPSPINREDFSSENAVFLSKTFEQAKSSLYPSRYDLRDLNKTSSVKEQEISGPCWTFATMSSLESNLLPKESLDFSENNLKNTHGFDWSIADGGNGDISTAYFTRWSGPVLESSDPYSSTSSVSPSNLSPAKHVQEVLYLPATSNSLDIDLYKKVITNYGAIFSYMRWMDGSTYYNNKTYGYYYAGKEDLNHAITIVGWDDDYSSANFNTLPQGNGAWIVKNSFGTGFGDKGYFYISYYDSVLFKTNDSYCFDNAEPVDNYSTIYQYDPLGLVNQVGFTVDPTTGWMANIFTATNDDDIKAVGFYTPEANCEYEIYIYKQWNGFDFSDMLSYCKGTLTYGGYHTIPLSSPAKVGNGNKFGVVVKVKTNGYSWPISLETKLAGYSSNATSLPGQSFYSANGVIWNDVTDRYPGGNTCIKAFSGSGKNVPGFITVNTYLDGKAWYGNISYNLLGNTSVSGTVAPLNCSVLAGIYNFSYINGGPANSTISKIDPSSSFSVASNETSSVNVYFTTIPSENFADLTVSNIKIVPAVPKIGENVTIYFDISNVGGGNVLTSYPFTISLDNKIISNTIDNNMMQTGISKTWKFNFNWPIDTNLHSIAISLDEPGNIIQESNETNNTCTLSLGGTVNELSKSSDSNVLIDSSENKYYVYGNIFGDDVLKFNFLTKEKINVEIYLKKNAFPTELDFDKKISLLEDNPSIIIESNLNDRLYLLVKPSKETINKFFSINTNSNVVMTYKLNCSISPENTGIINRNINNMEYTKGSSVVLTAIPQKGYVFDSWSGDITGKENPLSVLMNSDKNISANFKVAPALTLTTPKLNKIEIPEDRTVLITWNTVVDIDKVDTYAVYRKSSQEKDFSLIAIGGKAINSFTDKNIKYGETYSYYIVTKNNSKNVDSEHSNTLSISIPEKNHIIKLKLGSKLMYIGNFEANLDAAPISLNGRTFLPVRPILEAVGGKIDWNAKEQKVNISKENITIILWIGKNYGVVNGSKTPIDSDNSKIVPIISDGRTLLPIRFISEKLGANVTWNNSTKEITLNF